LFISKLEEKLQGTRLQESLSDLFKGKLERKIRCVNIDYETVNFEDFYDIQLDVQDCSSLSESFQRFTTVQQLVNENQYETEYGKQDVILEMRFIRIPPVLYFHLERFRYDQLTRKLIKINNRFSFPKTFEIPNYESYELFGVLVHAGTASIGHYYAFLRPTPAFEWFKFNDSSVTPASEYEAITNNFGNGVSFSNAYLLIYLRKSSIPELFTQPIPKVEFPQIDEEEEEILDGDPVSIVSDENLQTECSELGVKTTKTSGVFYLPKRIATQADYFQHTLSFLNLSKNQILNLWSLDPVDFIHPKVDRP